MKSVNVSALKNNPSQALRDAKEDIVLVMNRDDPQALMVGIHQTEVLNMPGVRTALATALFRDGELSLARAAKVAETTLADFIAHVSRLGIPVINQSAAETDQDMDTLDEWLASS